MIKAKTKQSLIQFGSYLILIWIVFLISLVFPEINNYGIRPRSLDGLVGILLAPFLHGHLSHIGSNSLALVTFTPLFILVLGESAIQKLILLTLATGGLTWLIAFPGNHIGASGLIFALYGYLILLGFIKKRILYLIISVGVLVTYGYMIFDVLPNQPGISWESHLAGFIVGSLFTKMDQ